MPIAKPTLGEVLRLGPAEIFVGDPMVADSMVSIGTLEGERRAEIEYSENVLKMPEHTGDIAHDATSSVSKANIMGTIILNGMGASIWPLINPLGSNAGGGDNFVRTPTTGVLLIPSSELGASLEWDASGTPAWKRTEEDDTVVRGAEADPVHSVWLWKARVKHGSIPYGFEDGGRTKVDVTFEGMYDSTKPNGARVFLIGNPRAFSTPINVVL